LTTTRDGRWLRRAAIAGGYTQRLAARDNRPDGRERGLAPLQLFGDPIQQQCSEPQRLDTRAFDELNQRPQVGLDAVRAIQIERPAAHGPKISTKAIGTTNRRQLERRAGVGRAPIPVENVFAAPRARSQRAWRKRSCQR